MRLPFLQVHQTAFARAKRLAPALGVDRQKAIGILIDLWQWAVELAPDDGPVEELGVFGDPDPSEVVAGAVEWTGDRQKLVEAFERSGIIEISAGSFRVKGLADIYGPVLEERKADRDRKRAAGSGGGGKGGSGGKPLDVRRSSAGKPPDLQRNSEGFRPSDADADADADAYTAAAAVPEPDAERHEEPAADEEFTEKGWWRWIQAERSSWKLEPEERPPAKWGAFVAAANVEGPERVAQALLAFLRDEHFRKRGWATAVFIASDVWRSRLPQGPPRPRDVGPDQGILRGGA